MIIETNLSGGRSILISYRYLFEGAIHAVASEFFAVAGRRFQCCVFCRVSGELDASRCGIVSFQAGFLAKSITAILVGEAIEALTGQSVTSYAQERIFQPGNIAEFEWAATPGGGTDTGGHLTLTASGLHHVGALIANGGWADGERIISAQWLAAMTAVQSNVYERRQKYGFLWWIDEFEHDGKRVRYVYAHGNGGNFVFAVPEYRFAASFTGVNFGNRRQFQPLQIFESKLLPALVDD